MKKRILFAAFIAIAVLTTLSINNATNNNTSLFSLSNLTKLNSASAEVAIGDQMCDETYTNCCKIYYEGEWTYADGDKWVYC